MLPECPDRKVTPMPVRLAAAVTATAVVMSLTAATAGATMAPTPGPQHKCDVSVDPIDEKCDDARN